MRHLINITDLSVDEINELIEIANDIIDNPKDYMDICHGKILATLFFEPSTRTRLSFTSAMMSLGGQVLGFAEAASSSAAKGESVSDTVRTVGCYSDIIAMRHPKEGAPLIASERTTVPPDTDSHRPSYNQQGKGQAGQHDHRSLRRPLLRQDRSFPY